MDQIVNAIKNARVARWAIGAALGGVFLAPVSSTSLHAQQLGFTVIPTATRISWDDALPLDEGWFYGGRLSMLFGSQVELQPFFLRGTKFGVDSSRGASVFGAKSLKRTLRIDHMGTNVQINLTDSDLSPFVRVGGGILKFTPDSGTEIKRLAVTAGGGFRLNLGGITGEVFAEQLQFRMEPGALFGAATPSDTARAKSPSLRNMSYGAAVSIPLSTFEGEQTSGLRGTRAPFEPFVGRLSFHEDMKLAEQDFMGIRTGLDFGPFVGLRGFYWRGVNKDHDRTQPISSYGGEAQFTLNDGRGVTPYVVMGAGRLDFDQDFRDSAGQAREDRTGLIIGGGARFSLTDRVHLNVAVRDFVFTRSDELTAAKTPDDLMHNRMLSAGFTVAIGGSSNTARERERVRERDEARDRAVDDRRDNVVMGEQPAATATPRAAASPRKVAMEKTMEKTIDVDTVRIVAPDASGRLITLPVPKVGEIIIRYGLPDRVDTGSIDTVIRMTKQVDTIRVEQRTPPTGANAERMSDLERQVSNLERELEQAKREREAMQNEQERVNDRVNDRTRVPRGVRRTDAPSFTSRLLDARPSDITPFVGLSTGDNTQVVVSARIDLGPMNSVKALDLVPELSLAVGGGRTTIMGMANARYSFGMPGSLRPYLMVGGGVSNNTLLVLGTSIGASINLRSASQSPVYGFAEVQGLNFFDQTRLMVGFSTRR